MKLLYEGIAEVKSYYPNIPDKQFDSLIRLDPTFDENKDRVGTYGKWILNLYQKNKQIDVFHITDLLRNFERNKRFLKNKDIMSFKSIDEVETYLADENSYNSETARQRLRAARNAAKNVDLSKETKTILDNEHWSVVIPLSYEASCALGEGTSWCTALRSNREYYDDYTSTDELYIIIDKDLKEKYQFHFKSESFMDEDDEPINIADFLLTNWDLYELFDGLGKLDEDCRNYLQAYSVLFDKDFVIEWPHEYEELSWQSEYGGKELLEFVDEIQVVDGSILDRDSFYGCTNATIVRIEKDSGVVSIEEGTFDDFESLQEIYIPYTVTHISADAMQYSTGTIINCDKHSAAEDWANTLGLEIRYLNNMSENKQAKRGFTLVESPEEKQNRYYLCGNYGLVGTPYPRSVTREEAEKKLASGHLLSSWGYVHEMYTRDDGIRREVSSIAPILYSKEDFDKFESKLKKSLSEDYLIEGIDDVRKFYPNIEDSDFDRIIRLDPTFRSDRDKVGTYGKWLLNLFQKGKLDNEGHVRDLLTRFEEVKNQLKNKDIMRYRSLEEVDEMLDNDDSYKDLSARQKLRQTQNAVRKTNIDEDASLVFEDSNWEVWVPHTYEASCKLGQGSTWCTASTSSDYYYRMYKNQFGGEYYININKRTKEKYQFHFESHQFMDKNDYSIDLEEFMNEPGNSGLSDFYLPIVNAVLDRELSDNDGGEYKFSESQMIDIYTKCTDFGEDIIKHLFWGEGLDFWYNADYVEMSYAKNEISKENLITIEKIVRAELMDDEDTFTFDIDEVDDDDINDAIRVAYSFAEDVGAENECIEDFIKSKEDLIYELHKSGYSAHWNEDNSLSVSIIRNAEDSPYLLIMRNPNETDEEVTGAVQDAIEFDEPYYGWQGFDKDYFNDDLADRLYEIAKERGINTDETN